MATTSENKSSRDTKSSAVLILGAGNMGGALAKGLSDSGFTVAVHDIHTARVEELCKKCHVRSAQKPEAELASIDALIFCVKPQDLATVAEPLAGKIRPNTLVVSILAGTPIAAIGEALQFKGGIVRAMPNIAATVHAAATGMSASPECSDEQRILAERIFRAIGEADWIKESLLDAVTGLSGSGPAYLYMVIEALTDGGVKMGIPRAQASRLATQTVLGSALLVKETGLHPAILRDQVTTPGGTTISAIHELEDRGLRAMLISAVETATKRSAALRSK